MQLEGSFFFVYYFLCLIWKVGRKFLPPDLSFKIIPRLFIFMDLPTIKIKSELSKDYQLRHLNLSNEDIKYKAI